MPDRTPVRRRPRPDFDLATVHHHFGEFRELGSEDERQVEEVLSAVLRVLQPRVA